MQDKQIAHDLNIEPNKIIKMRKGIHWNSIAKKFDGQGLQRVSALCGCLALWIGSPNDAIAKCALCVLMLKLVSYVVLINNLSFEGLNNEVSRND
ncbi:DUF3693 domain-containing protein [Vibrio sp. NTOU-M3]|uniref:DUF3693 domain-containing protein n=1 Tax=Vibrio sp. NTOU-M3 TaxID=3234954 RepID=UPI00349F8A75